MKWVTRERPKVDRIACPWLIQRFVDAEAEFLYVPGDQVKAVAVSSDGKTAYSGSFDRTIRVWNVAEGKETRQIPHGNVQVLALSLSPKGR